MNVVLIIKYSFTVMQGKGKLNECHARFFKILRINFQNKLVHCMHCVCTFLEMLANNAKFDIQLEYDA